MQYTKRCGNERELCGVKKKHKWEWVKKCQGKQLLISLLCICLQGTYP